MWLSLIVVLDANLFPSRFIFRTCLMGAAYAITVKPKSYNNGEALNDLLTSITMAIGRGSKNIPSREKADSRN